MRAYQNLNKKTKTPGFQNKLVRSKNSSKISKFRSEVAQMCSVKKGAIRNSRNSPAPESLFNKVAGLTPMNICEQLLLVLSY